MNYQNTVLCSLCIIAYVIGFVLVFTSMGVPVDSDTPTQISEYSEGTVPLGPENPELVKELSSVQSGGFPIHAFNFVFGLVSIIASIGVLKELETEGEIPV